MEVAGTDDWQRAREVRLAALADAPDAFFSTYAEEVGMPETAWRDRLASEDATTFLATDGDGATVGICVLAPAFDDPASLGLYGVWVRGSARGTGVADRLVEAAIATAERTGKDRLLLDVGDHNVAAQRFYARHGFTPTGRRSRFPEPRAHIAEHELARPLRPGRPA